MTRNFTFTLIILIFSTSILAQNRTVGLVEYNGKNQDGYCLFSPNGTKKTFLIDKCGRKVNEWTSDYAPGMSVTLQPDGYLYRAGVTLKVLFGGGTGGVIEKFDWDGNVLWTYILADSNNVLHHDFKVLPNGNLLLIIWENHSIADAISQGRDSTKTLKSIWSERISEIQPVGKDSAVIQWEWRAWDHLIQDHDSTKANFGIVKEHRELFDINFTNGNGLKSGQDWFHFNAIDYNPKYDQILLTSHSLDEIYIIDHSTSTAEAATHAGGKQKKGGDILYRWGNPISYRMGTTSDRKLFKPHHAHWAISDSVNSPKIFFYNNGLDRPVSNYTTVNSIFPPVSPDGSYTANLIQPFAPASDNTEYKAKKPIDFYSEIMGGAFQIGDNRFLITEDTKGTIFEVYRDTIVWKYINPFTPNGPTTQGNIPENNYVFRGQYYPANYSGFTGMNMTPGNEIEADPNPSKLCDPSPPPKYLIGQINRQAAGNGVGDSVGVHCQLNGIVQSPNFATKGIHIMLADKTGSIRLFDSSVAKNHLKPGDSIMVLGYVIQENGWLSFGNLDTLQRLDSSKSIKNTENSHQILEPNESKKVNVQKVRIKDISTWPGNPLTGNAYVTLAILHPDNSIDSMRLYSGTDISGTVAPTGYLDITGFVGQNDHSSPYKSNYFLMPTALQDFVRSPLPTVKFNFSGDTLNENKIAVNVNISTGNADAVSFDVVAIGGDAIPGTDYQFYNQRIQANSGNPTPSVVVNYGSNPKFDGNRFLQLAIRNLQGPATLGTDTVVTLYVQGKKENSSNTAIFDLEFSLYPNPTSDNIQLLATKDLKWVGITDLLGKVHYESNISGRSVQISPHLKTGYYVCTVQFADGTQRVQKIAVQ